MADGDVIRMRCSPANRKVLRKGVEAEFVRLALGIDGIYELCVEGPERLPDGSDHPLVPVEDDDG